ncbi:MAG: SRPBCC family protein [Blastocatellia bacterium]
MRILKKLLVLFGILTILLTAALVLAGLMMPAERSFTNEVEIDAPAEKVWDVITDKKRYTEWQTAITKVEIIDDKTWVEYPKDTPEPIKFSIAKDERPSRMEFHYTMGDSFNGHWKGEITSTTNGVKLKTTDSYKVAGWLSKILIGAFFDLDSFSKDWNSKLKTRVESQKNNSSGI